MRQRLKIDNSLCRPSANTVKFCILFEKFPSARMYRREMRVKAAREIEQRRSRMSYARISLSRRESTLKALNCEIRPANERKIARSLRLFICTVADLKSRPDHATGGKGTQKTAAAKTGCYRGNGSSWCKVSHEERPQSHACARVQNAHKKLMGAVPHCPAHSRGGCKDWSERAEGRGGRERRAM